MSSVFCLLQAVEAYLSHHAQFSLSHGICPTCHEKVRAAWPDDTPRE